LVLADINTGPFSVEFASSPSVCVGFLPIVQKHAKDRLIDVFKPCESLAFCQGSIPNTVGVNASPPAGLENDWVMLKLPIAGTQQTPHLINFNPLLFFSLTRSLISLHFTVYFIFSASSSAEKPSSQPNFSKQK